MTILIQEYLSQSAKKYPNKIAVSCMNERITYQEIDEFSNSLARTLISAGIRRQSFVPFFLSKSIKSIKSILGILKADCSYVPIDIHTPAQRLTSILDSINTNKLIVDNESSLLIDTLFPEDSRPTLINIDQISIDNISEIYYQNLSIDIAYVLFTSGSTGIPKGVMIPHKAIIDYIDWCVEVYQITDKDVVANHAPLYFDNSTFDIYTAFKSGATLHLVHDELNAVIPSLVNWIEQRQITLFFCVPSVLTLLMQSRRLKPGLFSHLKQIICAGESLPPTTLRFWMQTYPHIQYINMYGPTEITVDCSFHRIEVPPTETIHNIPIGKSRKNMELFVRLEDASLSQKVGSKGELLVRGTSVAYGYLGDQKRTEDSFIQNPSHNNYHDLLYCTGDIVEIDMEGRYLFLGRVDEQIKFLGHRIELGEIESALASLPSVSEAVVCFRQEGEFEEVHAEIGALVNLDNADIANVKNLLVNLLPGYMIPTHIKLFTEQFPRTPNGKYDRKNIKKILFEAK